MTLTFCQEQKSYNLRKLEKLRTHDTLTGYDKSICDFTRIESNLYWSQSIYNMAT